MPTQLENLTREEMIKYLTVIVALLKKLQDGSKKEMETLKQEVETSLEQVRLKKGDKGDSPTKEELLKLIEPLIPEVQDGYTPIKGKDYFDGKNGLNGTNGKDGRDGRDGKDADEIAVALQASKTVLDEVLPLIPTIDQIEQDLPRLGEKIRDGLELLPEGEKLEITAIENLRKELDELQRKIELKTNYVSGGGGVGKHNVVAYDLSSQLNGVLKTFSLPSLWKVISVTLSSFPGPLRPTVDYTVSGNSITFTSTIDADTALETGQTAIVIYSE